jgi:hypothetical protein
VFLPRQRIKRVQAKTALSRGGSQCTLAAHQRK